MKDLTVEQCQTLALDLLRQLSADIGDPEAVTATLLRWSDELDHPAFAFVSMAALQRIFLDCLCLSTVPADQIPPGSTTYQQPKEAA